MVLCVVLVAYIVIYGTYLLLCEYAIINTFVTKYIDTFKGSLWNDNAVQYMYNLFLCFC